MINFNIRKACKGDVQAVLKIEKEEINSWSESQFSEETERENTLFYIIESENVILGYIVAWIIHDEIDINSIAVKSKFRGKGLALLLLNQILSGINSEEINKIFVEVRSRNSSAIRFYHKNGFTKIGVRKNYYGDDDAHIMEKTLENEK